MRSRYTAYTLVDVNYILQTTHPSTRRQYTPMSIREWAESNTWMGLEVIASTEKTVTFKAHYLDEDRIPHTHSEHSTFRQENGTWYFLEGRVS